MEESPGFLHAFGICRTCLTMSGLWSDTHFKKSKKFVISVLYAANVFVILTFMNVAQTVKLFLIWGDFDEMSQIISTSDFSVGMLVVKMFVFRSYRKALALLIEFVEKDWLDLKTISEEETMEQNAHTANKIYLTCFFLGNSAVNSYTLLRLGQEMSFLPGPPDKRQPLFDAYFPYDDKRSPAYEITWLMQYAGIALANLAFTGMYCLFVGLMLHLCGQFANLRIKLIEAVSRKEGESEKKSDGAKTFRERLAFIVERHNSLNKYAQVIEKIYHWIFFVEILSSTIQMCSQWFMLVTVISNTQGGLPYLQIGFLLIFTAHSGFHLFACCYAAERLQNESLSIFEAAYSCEWYNLSPQDAKMLLFIMQRTKTPLRVTAGKLCVFGLELFAKILKTAGGYLSILLAMRDRLVIDEEPI
ncbi:odorant receptor 24 [Nasonia vitripennis]|uniref:Odorant receptor n=1 Tax=Nasonia vitripennis TaxID=7425 RepID=A0A7M6UW55_NASVI|nr:odorant receptor 24 [Nasonia vitripennis]